jgi:hypothetical protein
VRQKPANVKKIVLKAVLRLQKTPFIASAEACTYSKTSASPEKVWSEKPQKASRSKTELPLLRTKTKLDLVSNAKKLIFALMMLDSAVTVD